MSYNAQVEQIKERIKLSDLAKRYVNLKPKSNGEYVGLCPFHSERSPSFTISEYKNFYHCFGCGEHGDIFSFLMKVERLEYKEALQQLAKQAGVVLQYKGAETDHLKKNYQIYKNAMLIYKAALTDIRYSKLPQQYLAKRGFNKEVAEKFNLGYSPNYYHLARHLITQFPEEELLAAKILRKGSTLYDIFVDRLIFPIQDRQGRVIAFGGRLLENKEGAPKYLNSADNPIFSKTHTLYGLLQGKEAIIKKSQAIIVEGYVDVISLHQYEICNVVAPLGTSLKMEHYAILSKMCNEIVVCLDGDAAGFAAMNRFIRLLLPTLDSKMKIRFMVLPQGQDPDDFVRKYGKENFLNRMVSALNLPDFIFNSVQQDYDLKTPEGGAQMQKTLNELAGQITDYHLRQAYEHYFRQSYWALRKNLKENKSEAIKGLPTSQNKIPNISPLYELVLLAVAYPAVMDMEELYNILLEAEIKDKDIDKLRCLLIEFYYKRENGSFTIDIITYIRNGGGNLQKFEKFIERFNFSSINCTELAANILRKYQLDTIAKDIDMLKQKLKHHLTDQDLNRYNALIKLRNQLKSKNLP